MCSSILSILCYFPSNVFLICCALQIFTAQVLALLKLYSCWDILTPKGTTIAWWEHRHDDLFVPHPKKDLFQFLFANRSFYIFWNIQWYNRSKENEWNFRACIWLHKLCWHIGFIHFAGSVGGGLKFWSLGVSSSQMLGLHGIQWFKICHPGTSPSCPFKVEIIQLDLIKGVSIFSCLS